MLQSLFTAIVESLVVAAGNAILRFLGWEKAAELVRALFGLACIAIGVAIVLLNR